MKLITGILVTLALVIFFWDLWSVRERFGLDTANFILSFIAVLATSYLAFVALRFTARPRIKIFLVSDGKNGYYVNETVELRFHLNNIGYWYARPAATNNSFYINFPSTFELVNARYGSVLENVETEVRSGKSESRYFKIGGIHLFYGEAGEEFLVTARMPASAGLYPMWITATSEQGDHGVHKFRIKVKEARHTWKS